MFDGRAVQDSYGVVGAPAMTVHDGGLLLAWPTTDGKIRMAAGLEQDGVGESWSLPDDFTLVRPSLASFGGRVYLSYGGTDRQSWLAVSDDGGRTFGDRSPWLPESIGAPTIFSYGDGGELWASRTGVPDLGLSIGFGTRETLSFPSPSFLSLDMPLPDTSIDPPAISASVYNELLLAWTGSDLRLNVRINPENPTEPGRKVTFDDICRGGPAVAKLLFFSGFVYCGFDGHIYILFNTEFLERDRAQRSKYADTTAFCPAVCRLGNEVFVAWFGTDADNTLYFANIGAMPVLESVNHAP